MTSPVRAIMIGAGQRGTEAYGPYALKYPEKLNFVAVAEPDLGRRARFGVQHGIAPEDQYGSWEALFANSPDATAALVCTQDSDHTAPTLAALQAGYHVLLEKPMAQSAAECINLVRVSEETGRQLHI